MIQVFSTGEVKSVDKHYVIEVLFKSRGIEDKQYWVKFAECEGAAKAENANRIALLSYEDARISEQSIFVKERNKRIAASKIEAFKKRQQKAAKYGAQTERGGMAKPSHPLSTYLPLYAKVPSESESVSPPPPTRIPFETSSTAPHRHRSRCS
mgnify:CR=1 FL=1